MSYVGNTPTQQAFTPAVDYFSGNASTTAFTLSRPVASVAQMVVVIANVIQNPSSAYTVSGNTITFTSAPPSGTNNIWVEYTSPITQVIAPGQNTVYPTSLSAGGPSWDTNGNVTVTTSVGTGSGTALQIKSNGTTNATLDTNGMLGVGITPSQSSGIAIELGGSANNNAINFLNSANVQGWITSNAYYNGTNWLRKFAGGVTCTAYATNVNGTHTWNYAASGSAGSTISWTQAMTLDANGNLGLGSTSPYNPGGSVQRSMEIAGNSTYATTYWTVSSRAVIGAVGVQNSDNTFHVSTNTNNPLLFDTNGTERARIDSSGNLFLGGTTQYNSAKFTISYAGSVNNGIALIDTTNQTGTQFLAFTNGSGTQIGSVARVTTTNAVVYNTTSDERLKSNIQNAAPVLDKLMQVQVRQYDWTEGNLHQDYGFIAQELEPVLSGIVTKGQAEKDVWQLDYSRLTPHLVKAIQELKAEFDAYKAAHP